MAQHTTRIRTRPPTDFANTREVSEGDRRILGSATGREEGRAPDEPLSDFEAEVLSHDGGGRPRSEVTGGPEGGTPDDTTDGLDPTDEEVRRQAEDRATGRGVDGKR